MLLGTSDTIKQAALSGHRSNNPARILKAVVDMLKERYLAKVYDPLSMDEILKEINLIELRTDIKHEIYEVSLYLGTDICVCKTLIGRVLIKRFTN